MNKKIFLLLSLASITLSSPDPENRPRSNSNSSVNSQTGQIISYCKTLPMTSRPTDVSIANYESRAKTGGLHRNTSLTEFEESILDNDEHKITFQSSSEPNITIMTIAEHYDSRYHGFISPEAEDPQPDYGRVSKHRFDATTGKYLGEKKDWHCTIS